MSEFSALFRVISGIGICLAVASSTAQAAESDSHKSPAPATSQSNSTNRCFVRLEDGPVLAVPEQFWNAQTCATAKQPLTQQWIGFDINYPDMTPGSWVGVMDQYLAKNLGTGPSVANFSARIVWLFSPGDIPKVVTDRGNGPEPQVWQIIENAKQVAKREHGFPTPAIGISEINGLRTIKFGNGLKPSPEALKRLEAEGWTPPPHEGDLIEMPGADYELIAHCDGQFACLGHVYIKSNRIQYRFLIPLRAKAHMAEFITSINTLVKSWAAR